MLEILSKVLLINQILYSIVINRVWHKVIYSFKTLLINNRHRHRPIPWTTSKISLLKVKVKVKGILNNSCLIKSMSSSTMSKRMSSLRNSQRHRSKSRLICRSYSCQTTKCLKQYDVYFANELVHVMLRNMNSLWISCVSVNLLRINSWVRWRAISSTMIHITWR